MKKILNSKETLIEDMLAGFIAAKGKKSRESRDCQWWRKWS